LQPIEEAAHEVKKPMAKERKKTLPRDSKAGRILDKVHKKFN